MHVKPYGVIFACIVDAKGPTPTMVRTVSGWIKLFGLVNFRYRSDKEHAVVRLLDDAIRESGRHAVPFECDDLARDIEEHRLLEPDDTPAPVPTYSAVPGNTLPGESRSNGAVKRAVQIVEVQARTLLAALSDRIGWEIPAEHPIMHWLVHHSAYLLTRFHAGEDGLTPYQRLHGKSAPDRIAEFGERVLWFVPVKRRAKLEPKWRNGMFIGRAWGSDQNFVALMDGSVTRA